MSFQGTGHGESAMPMRESPHASIRKLKTAGEVKEATGPLGGNLLNEREFLDGPSSGAWKEHLQEKMDDKEVFAFEVREGDALVRFALANKEGEITQIRALEGKEERVIERTLHALREEDIPNPTLRLKEKSEHVRHVLEKMGFELHAGDHENDDGKFEMKKRIRL